MQQGTYSTFRTDALFDELCLPYPLWNTPEKIYSEAKIVPANQHIESKNDLIYAMNSSYYEQRVYLTVTDLQ